MADVYSLEKGLDHLYPEYQLQYKDNIDGFNKTFNPSMIDVNKTMFKKSMEMIEHHKWMKECKFTLATYTDPKEDYELDIEKFDNIDQLIALIDDRCEMQDPEDNPVLKEPKKIVAFDLETTGLRNRHQRIGGKKESQVGIVGICVAYSETEGYYIPIKHNELDGIKNWTIQDAVKLINYFQQDNHLVIWHNAIYDLFVSISSGVTLNKSMNHDTYLLWKMTFEEEFSNLFQYGLKLLSERFLKRKMQTINDLLGVDAKAHIEFQRLPSVNAVTYAVSDATNTYALWKYLFSKKFRRNPYTKQPIATRLEMRSIYDSLSMLSTGIPINTSHAIPMLKTIYRRQILLQSKFDQLVGDGFTVITSDEKCGMYIGKTIMGAWEESGKDKDQGYKFLEEKFGMKMTVRNGAGGVKKETFSNADSVLEALLKSLPNMDFIKDEQKKSLTSIIKYIQAYRSLDHERSGYLGIIRSVTLDDRGYPFVHNSLNLNGTDCVIKDTPINIRVNKSNKPISTTMDKLDRYCDYDDLEGEYEFNEYIEIETIDGWVHITHFVTKHKDTIEISTKSRSIGVATRHRFMNENDRWIYANELKIGDFVKTIDGYEEVTKIINLKGQMTYDIVTNHKQL